MRRSLFATVLPAITALAAFVLAGPAQAAREPVPWPTLANPGTYPARVCGFPVDVAAITNNEYQDVTTLADGTKIIKTTGNLVVWWRNDLTGKTIIRHLSGPTTETDYPDGTGVSVGEGLNFWTFGPISQSNTGEPGIVFTTGHVIVTFHGIFADTFSLSGTQVNACALLAG
jgi:hypothetical protein